MIILFFSKETSSTLQENQNDFPQLVFSILDRMTTKHDDESSVKYLSNKIEHLE